MISKIEQASAPIVEEIKRRPSLRGLSEDKCIWLSGFTALQHVRTKNYSERSQYIMRQVTQFVTEVSGGKLSKKLREQLGVDAPGTGREHAVSMMLGLVRPVTEELLKKTPVLYESDGSEMFWIGDNPVALMNTINPSTPLRSNLGFAVPGIEIYLPISKNLLLAYMCPSIAVAFAGMEEDARRMGFTHGYAHSYLHAIETGSPVPISKEHIRCQNSLQLG